MTGQPAFDRVFDSSGFDYCAEHPDAAQIFINGMTSASAIEGPAVVAAYDFSRFERIVDVGGGQGALLHAILSATPGLQGVLADQPYVVEGAASLQTGPIAGRCEVAGVDFFQTVPEGADAYIMKLIIHDWNDDDALKILKNCRRAIRRDGTLLIVDAVLKPPNEPDPGKLRDLNMLVTLRGLERTEAEFRMLLKQAGFSLTRVIPTAGLLSIIESMPV
jgi:hypothetical protein